MRDLKNTMMNESYKSIDPIKTNQYIITWDTGKRCNFDCAYCGPDRHDLSSPFPSFDELIKGVDFIKEYLGMMMPYRNEQTASLSLTGGEPTANPSFLKFSKYLKDQFKDFDYDVYTILTTNGSFPEKIIPHLVENFRGITLSYHCDSKEKLKEKVRENVLILNNSMKSFKVNLMMHPYDQYWQECMDFMEVMDEHKVKYVPRVINGLEYNEEQALWLRDYWQNKNSKNSATKVTAKKVNNVMTMATEEVYTGRKMKKDVAKVYKELKSDETKKFTVSGRHCCSKHQLSCGLTCDKTETQTYISDTRFQDWYCSVNWFFLHLESQTDQIFHHQTCQAQYGKGRGAVGSISDYKIFTNKVKGMLDKGVMEPIICPNKKCGCGMCATKANSFVDFSGLISKHVKGITYEFE